MSKKSALHHYSLHGLTIASDLALFPNEVSRPQLSANYETANHTLYIFERQAPVALTPVTWHHEVISPDGREHVEHGRFQDCLILRIRHLLTAEITTCGTAIRYQCESENPDDIAAALVSQVIPAALYCRFGGPFLHAAAILAESGLTLFVGPSGAGKSTLALAVAQAGGTVFADDGIRLFVENSQVMGFAGAPDARIHADAKDFFFSETDCSEHEVALGKFRVPLRTNARQQVDFLYPQKIGKIFFLANSPAPVAKISSELALRSLLASCFRLGVDQPDWRLSQELSTLILLIAQAEIRTVGFSRDHRKLASEASLLLPDLALN